MKKFTSLTKFAKSFALLAVMLVSTLTSMAQEPSAAYTPAKANNWWAGEVASNNKLAYLFNVGANIFLTQETPSETDIDKSSLWNIEASNKGEYKFTNTYRIHMESGLGWIWTTKISTSDDATAFTLADGTTKDRGTAYKLAKKASISGKNCYFTVKGKKFSAEEDGSANNDFLFISDTQKETYTEYVNLFKNAASYLDNEYIKKSNTATKALMEALTAAAKGTYSSYTTDKANLEKAIQDAKAYIKGAANGWWRGEKVADGKQVYLFNVGAGTFVTNNVASETKIDNADLWTIKKSTDLLKNSYYSFTSKKDYRLYMESNWKYEWSVDVTTSQNATGFSLIDGESTGVGTVYKLSNTYALVSTRYFNVEGEKYTAAKSKSEYNDFIFISQEQKEKFNNYEELYNEAYKLRFNETIEQNEEITALLTDALEKTSKGSFDSYESDKDTLEKAIKAAKDYLSTTGINNIENNADAKIETIYDLNGVRQNSLTKGINIVKMSNGKTKKVIVK